MNFINSLDSTIVVLVADVTCNSTRSVVNFVVIVALSARREYPLSLSLFFALMAAGEKTRDPIYYGDPRSPLPATRKSITSNEYNMKGMKG